MDNLCVKFCHCYLLILRFVCFGAVLQAFVLQPKVEPEIEEGTPLCTLLRDPYILIAAGEGVVVQKTTCTKFLQHCVKCAYLPSLHVKF